MRSDQSLAVGEAEGAPAPAPASEASIRVSTGRGGNPALPDYKTSICDSSCVEFCLCLVYQEKMSLL
jgi:hypothetical protein